MIEASWTWGSIIDALGGTGEVASALALLPSVVSGWRERGIPGPRWAAVVALAADRGAPDITLEVLAGLAARKLDPVDAEGVRT